MLRARLIHGITLAQGPLNIEPTYHELLKITMLRIVALEKYDKRGTSETVYYRGSHRTWEVNTFLLNTPRRAVG